MIVTSIAGPLQWMENPTWYHRVLTLHAVADSLMSQMTVEEITQAAEWMTNAPSVCEQQ